MRRLSVLFLVLLAGCTTYHHQETFHEDGTLASWETNIKRTWGTSEAEFFIEGAQERGSVGGSGISSNMSNVLGDDAVGKIVMGVTGRSSQPVFIPVPSIDMANGEDNTE